MDTQEILDHVEIYGKVCFTCDLCSCDQENEDLPEARFWCNLPVMKKLQVNKRGALNMDCEKWIIRDDFNQ
jgi:hypothetical protein